MAGGASGGDLKGEADRKGSESGSWCSDTDILNRSLQSDGAEALDSVNYLRYASEKFNQKLDILDIVDKNERSFKQVAERMINRASQLVTSSVEDASGTGTIDGNVGGPTRRLMHMKLFSKIADRFHGDIKIAQGLPSSIAALEDFIAIGSSDGSVRLFDQAEQEIKTLTDKSIRQNAVTCLDFKRIGASRHIYVVSGHSKGHVSLYEIKGLLQQDEFLAR